MNTLRLLYWQQSWMCKTFKSLNTSLMSCIIYSPTTSMSAASKLRRTRLQTKLSYLRTTMSDSSNLCGTMLLQVASDFFYWKIACVVLTIHISMNRSLFSILFFMLPSPQMLFSSITSAIRPLSVSLNTFVFQISEIGFIEGWILSRNSQLNYLQPINSINNAVCVNSISCSDSWKIFKRGLYRSLRSLFTTSNYSIFSANLIKIKNDNICFLRLLFSSLLTIQLQFSFISSLKLRHDPLSGSFI